MVIKTNGKLWFAPAMPLRPLCLVYGTSLLALWTAGLVYVIRRGRFMSLPDDPSLLRNMVYFPKLRVDGVDATDAFVSIRVSA